MSPAKAENDAPVKKSATNARFAARRRRVRIGRAARAGAGLDAQPGTSGRDWGRELRVGDGSGVVVGPPAAEGGEGPRGEREENDPEDSPVVLPMWHLA